jgi:hypothetical protein
MVIYREKNVGSLFSDKRLKKCGYGIYGKDLVLWLGMKLFEIGFELPN